MSALAGGTRWTERGGEKKNKGPRGRTVLRGVAGCADGLGLGLAQQGWKVAAVLFFFEKDFLLLFLRQNKHNFLNKTPNEFKIISKFIYKQNTLNKTTTLSILK